MILSYIQGAGNEGEHLDCILCVENVRGLTWRQGIWTKHLKAKTELHQTVIDRCLKSLSQKQLIKSVKSVKVRNSPTPIQSPPHIIHSILRGKSTCSTILSLQLK